jgi:eukaryotic-like serine/threonine-protein kinase
MYSHRSSGYWREVTTASEETAERLIASRYLLRSAIGHGGMGVVWVAEDTLLRRSVAVKELRFPVTVTADEQATLRERSLREARAAARLDSPHVVRIYDVVDEDGRPCIVMELLRGQTLSQLVRAKGPLSPGEVARIGKALADALQVAHAEGVVHRDVKPGNVFLTDNGRVVLTDFGIATSAGDSSLTETGLLVGSPAYMAPERARGGEPTPASDLWSLGATLYTAVEGHAAFDAGDPVGTLTSVVTDPPQPIRRTRGPLAEIIGELLSKNPAGRPSAALVSRELGAFAAANDDALTSTAPMPAVAAGERESRNGERVTAVRLVDGEVRPAAEPARDHEDDRRGGALAGAAALGGAAFGDGGYSSAESTSSVGLPVVGALPGAGDASDGGYSAYSAYDALDGDGEPPVDQRGRRRMLVALIAVAVVVAAAVAVAFTGLPGSSDDGTPSSSASHRPGSVVSAPPAKAKSASPSASASSGSGAGSGATGSAAPSQRASSGSGASGSTGSSGSGSSGSSGSGSSGSGTSGSVAGVPAGWQTFTSSEGWSVAHPSDWSVRTHTVHGQTVTDMVSPTGELLRVNITPTPFEQPIDDWRNYEPTFAQQVSDYSRIDMRALTVDGDPAADWEFTYSSGGAALHAVDREIRDGETVYAVLFQTHADEWDAAAGDRQAALASFRPAGG